MYQYSASSKPLTETEVFVGSVLGKDGGLPNKWHRAAATDMKEKFDRDLDYTIGCIMKGLGEDSEIDRGEALARSIACLAIAVKEPERILPRVGRLQSFGYVVAAVCLKEIDHFHEKLKVKALRRGQGDNRRMG
jgi:hypothetical protein